MCNCIDLTQEALIKHNQRLPLMLSLVGGPSKPYMQAEVIKPKRGERPMQLIPSYCPFCGEKYPDTD